MRKLIAACLSAVVFTGCATSAPMRWSDGKDATNINCSGTALSWDMCLSEAGNVCPDGYTALNKVREAGATALVQYNQFTRSFTSTTVPTVSRHLYIRCDPQ